MSKHQLRRVKQKNRREMLRKKLAEAKNDLDDGIFAFINRKFEQKEKVDETDEGKRAVKEKSALKGETTKALNIKSFALDEAIKQAEKKLRHYEESAKRNEQNDPVTAGRMRAKFKEVQTELAALRRQQANVTNEQKSRTNTKKSSIFWALSYAVLVG